MVNSILAVENVKVIPRRMKLSMKMPFLFLLLLFLPWACPDMPVFGCLGHAKIYVRGKQENKARKVVFLSAGDHMKGDHVRDITAFHSSL